jgi:hypothetical protein
MASLIEKLMPADEARPPDAPAPEQVKGGPSAMAIPAGGFLPGGAEQGRFGPIFPRTPLNYGFTIIARIVRGREPVFAEYARNIQAAVAETPDCLAVLQLHTLKWVLFEIGDDTYFMYQGIFDTDFDKYTEDAVSIFAATGLNTVFENLEGFPADWKSNPEAFIRFVRDHHRPSFLEYCEYSYTTAREVKSALAVKAGLGGVLDNMQL